MTKIAYTEPADYFPKKVRKKNKIGEFNKATGAKPEKKNKATKSKAKKSVKK